MMCGRQSGQNAVPRGRTVLEGRVVATWTCGGAWVVGIGSGT